jgi:hypothetical protein
MNQREGMQIYKEKTKENSSISTQIMEFPIILTRYPVQHHPNGTQQHHWPKNQP